MAQNYQWPVVDAGSVAEQALALAKTNERDITEHYRDLQTVVADGGGIKSGVVTTAAIAANAVDATKLADAVTARLLTKRGAAVTSLGSDAEIANIVAVVNETLVQLRAAGVIASA